eukprot:6854871-Alexandrium_andersonii.AAC.1
MEQVPTPRPLLSLWSGWAACVPSAHSTPMLAIIWARAPTVRGNLFRSAARTSGRWSTLVLVGAEADL